ncbi:hypothetical protein M917_2179 [Psychrobacter aquaticus CMS 56]|uniref:Uncharacterized protein n=1 Tax=Psychrobacter aquaticus CMS 56 TaxID=1354303 RepID=U4T8M3_9GAMM|nr:hypothetical protein M917_2179 [Psychrobacter aquaticus CMS 56]
MLSNVGNVRDIYIIRPTGNDDPNITMSTSNYALGITDITYIFKQ